MIANGATLIGTADQTLTFNGNLALGASSVVSVSYGAEFGTALFNVKGDLALGSTINVTDFGGSGPGVYQVFHNDGNQSGTITLGTLPGHINDPSKVRIQQTANDVNIVNTDGVTLIFWDGGDASKHNNGSVDGGAGTWDAQNNDNWTDLNGGLNGSWMDDDFAIFQNTAGVVNVDNSHGAVKAAGMQFSAGGYQITGDDLTLVPSSLDPDEEPIIRVGDGGDADVDKVVTISAKLVGADGMHKTGQGKLVLTENNDYTGGTIVSGGILQLGDGGTKGSVGGEISLGSTAASAGTLTINRSDNYDLTNDITGVGHVEIDSSGEIELSGMNTDLAGILVKRGTLIVSQDDNLGGSGVEIDDGAILRFKAAFDSAHNYVFAGGTAMIETTGSNVNKITTAITGPGSLTKAGAGTLVLAADSNYAGGTLQIGDGGITGRIDGAITNNGVVAFNRSDVVAMGNVISGTGSVKQIGTGTLTLTGTNTYSGGTTVSAGILKVESNGNLGSWVAPQALSPSMAVLSRTQPP